MNGERQGVDKYVTALMTLAIVFLLVGEYMTEGANTLELQIGCIMGLAVSQIAVLLSKQNFTIALIHWFFVFLFFGIVPAVKVYYNVFPLLVTNTRPERVIRQTNYILLLWCMLYSIAYNFSHFTSIIRVRFRRNVDRKTTLLIMVALLGCLAFFIFVQAPYALFIRGGGIQRAISSTIPRLFLQYFCRPSAFFLMCIVLFESRLYQGDRDRKKLIVATLLLFLCFDAPSATARFYAFAIWLSVVFMAYLYKFRTGWQLLGILSGGIFGAEFLNIFRRLNGSFTLSSISFDTQFWTSMTFDAYEMLGSSVAFVSARGILYGENILGAMGFFVPRSLWTSKPIGSGAMIMQEHYRFNSPYGKFDNVSCPLVAEVFLSFGFFGVLVGAVSFAMIAKFLDQNYRYTLKSVDVGVKSFRALYFVLGGTFFFMMRGDLLSSTAYVTGITASFVAIVYLLKGEIILSRS